MNDTSIAGLELCEFDDECSACDAPEGRVFVSLCHIPMEGTEADFYICEKCIAQAVRRKVYPPSAVTAPSPITEEMHQAACKVLLRAAGLDGTPQRMLDALAATAPTR